MVAIFTQREMVKVLSCRDAGVPMLTYWLLALAKLRQLPYLQEVALCQVGEFTSVPVLPLPELSAVVVPDPSFIFQYAVMPPVMFIPVPMGYVTAVGRPVES